MALPWAGLGPQGWVQAAAWSRALHCPGSLVGISSHGWEQQEQRSWAEQPTTPRCMQMGREPQELQQGCAVYPPGLPCQRRGDKNRFNLQNHPLDTKSKQLVRSRVRDVKGAGRDPLVPLCIQHTTVPLLPKVSDASACRAGNMGARCSLRRGPPSRKHLGTSGNGSTKHNRS